MTILFPLMETFLKLEFDISTAELAEWQKEEVWKRLESKEVWFKPVRLKVVSLKVLLKNWHSLKIVLLKITDEKLTLEKVTLSKSTSLIFQLWM